MAVLRNRTKRENFLVVSKIFLQDADLNLTERGLLATMHSLPEKWEFTVKGMAKVLPDGESRIRSALDGLIKKEYVSKEQSKADGGKFGRNVIEIFERPFSENPVADNPMTENPVSVKSLPDNQGQYNIKEYNTKEYSTNRSINLSYQNGMEGMTNEAAYRTLIAENIKLD